MKDLKIKKNFLMIIVKYIQEFLWHRCRQCGVSSVSDSSLFQFILLLEVYMPIPMQSVLTTRFQSVAPVTSKVVLFILASVCKSLQCLISTLTQGAKMVTYLGSFVQLCCGEGGTLQISLVCGECLQCLGHTGFAPTPGVCAFRLYCSGSRLLCKGIV